MRSNIFKDVVGYIEFLRKMGYNCVLSHFDTRFEPYTQELYFYEIHMSSVCHYLKRNCTTKGKCNAQKTKLNLFECSEPYYSCCYAGVEEYIFPVNFEGETIMRIHISGYRDTLEKSKYCKEKISQICDGEFLKLYNELFTNPPSLNEVEMFTKPLEYMIVELYKYCQKSSQMVSETKKVYLKAIALINEKYADKITVESLAKMMNYSPSYLRYAFKKEGGISPNKQINEIRLENAKFLLLNTTLNITEISYRCGFADSNYFSTVFKEKYGKPPKGFKKMNIQ